MVPTSISPPTDNLYKFIAIAGIVLFLVGALLFWDATSSVYRTSAKIEIATADLDRESQRFYSSADEMGEAVERQSALLDLAEQAGPLDDDAVERVDSLRSLETVIYAKLAIVQEASDSLAAVHSRVDEIADAHSIESSYIKLSIIVGFVLMFAGFYISERGFKGWYQQVQKHEDIIIRAAAAQAQRQLDAMTSPDPSDPDTASPPAPSAEAPG